MVNDPPGTSSEGYAHECGRLARTLFSLADVLEQSAGGAERPALIRLCYARALLVQIVQSLDESLRRSAAVEPLFGGGPDRPDSDA